MGLLMPVDDESNKQINKQTSRIGSDHPGPSRQPIPLSMKGCAVRALIWSRSEVENMENDRYGFTYTLQFAVCTVPGGLGICASGLLGKQV